MRLHYSANFATGDNCSRVRPCILLKLRAEGIEGRIGSGGAVGCRELSEALQGLSGNPLTGHITVELSLLKAILLHEFFKVTAATIAAKVFGLPLRLALQVELGQSFVDECNGGEETLDGLFRVALLLFLSTDFHIETPGRTVVGGGVYAIVILTLTFGVYVNLLDNASAVNFMVVSISTPIPTRLIPDELREGVAKLLDGTIRLDFLLILCKHSQNFLNVIIFSMWRLFYRSGERLSQFRNCSMTPTEPISAHSQHPVDRLFKVLGRVGKGFLPKRHLSVLTKITNRITCHIIITD
ncbi:uncharacterized protein BcabD6B2_21540 [Babesia caballi]|uniref:Uncharacterized protein n=1 Tax=Babesia caballi TaxID=5871 RepID=A0AAV4LSC1_BABCB|nr:hypothetical protein BcabD6B2_21540 [Babesia caballi]